MSPEGLAWVVVVARLSFAVTARADVKNAFGIVVRCQVLRRIGTPCAEFHSHLPPPEAKKRPSCSLELQFAGAPDAEFRALGLLWLRSIGLIADICHLPSAIPDWQ